MMENFKNVRAEAWGSDLDRYVLSHPVKEIDGVVVDVDAFFRTRSGCDLCAECCAYGTAIPAETAAKLEPHLKEITEKYIPKERQAAVGWHDNAKRPGVLHTNLATMEDGKKSCCFLYKDGERKLCSIYSWALETKREVYDYWPFECIMYPMAIFPYDGILHPGKTFLTLRMKTNWHFIDVYGGMWRATVARRLLTEIRTYLRKLLAKFGLPAEKSSELAGCYFKDTGIPKPPSYQYFGPQLRWYFGDEFFKKVSEAASEFIGSRTK